MTAAAAETETAAEAATAVVAAADETAIAAAETAAPAEAPLAKPAPVYPSLSSHHRNALHMQRHPPSMRGYTLHRPQVSRTLSVSPAHAGIDLRTGWAVWR